MRFPGQGPVPHRASVRAEVYDIAAHRRAQAPPLRQQRPGAVAGGVHRVMHRARALARSRGPACWDGGKRRRSGYTSPGNLCDHGHG